MNKIIILKHSYLHKTYFIFTTRLIAFPIIIGKSFQNLISSICEQTSGVQPEFMSRLFETTHSYANISLELSSLITFLSKVPLQTKAITCQL